MAQGNGRPAEPETRREIELAFDLQLGSRKQRLFREGDAGIAWGQDPDNPGCIRLVITHGRDAQGRDIVDVHSIPMHRLNRHSVINARASAVHVPPTPTIITPGRA